MTTDDWFWTFYKRVFLACVAGGLLSPLVIPHQALVNVFGENLSWGWPATGVAMGHLVAYCTMPPYPRKINRPGQSETSPPDAGSRPDR